MCLDLLLGLKKVFCGLFVQFASVFIQFCVLQLPKLGAVDIVLVPAGLEGMFKNHLLTDRFALLLPECGFDFVMGVSGVAFAWAIDPVDPVQ